MAKKTPSTISRSDKKRDERAQPKTSDVDESIKNRKHPKQLSSGVKERAVSDIDPKKRRQSDEKAGPVQKKHKSTGKDNSLTKKIKGKHKEGKNISSDEVIRGRPELKKNPDDFREKFLLNMNTAEGCHVMVSLTALGRIVLCVFVLLS